MLEPQQCMDLADVGMDQVLLAVPDTEPPQMECEQKNVITAADRTRVDPRAALASGAYRDLAATLVRNELGEPG